MNCTLIVHGRRIIQCCDGLRQLPLEREPASEPLVVRDYESGQVVATIPPELSDGLLPIVNGGLVVGYYIETTAGKRLAKFGQHWRGVTYWPCEDPENWAMVVRDGQPAGYVKPVL